VALHPKSHLDFNERNAYERLHPLVGVRVGKDHIPFNLDELKVLHEPLGVITVELPLRQAGYKLPSWAELTAISDWAREQKTPLHIDGARLWESAPYYQRSYAEIAALADSVYVSFYKGLGGLGGCILAGSRDFIEEVKVWKTRLGGNLFTAFPYIISALEGLHHHLPKMEAYCARAREIAAALAELPGVVTTPDPPHTNSFQIYLPQDWRKLRRAARKLAQTEKIWLFGMLEEIAVPGLTMAEITIGEAAEGWSTSEVVTAVRQLLTLSRE
jgi:threonine aldolase